MSKKIKIALGILVPSLVIIVVVYYLLNSIYVEEEQPLIYPESTLSDSLFVAQNTEYVKNEALTKVHEFSTIPYKLDVCEGDGAKVGVGTVYRVTDTIYIYVAEFDDSMSLQGVLKDTFPKAILYNYKEDASSISCVSADSGYINGYLAHYFVDQFYISDGMTNAMSCMLGYCLDIPDEYEGNNLLVAVGTTDETSEAFANCKVVLDSLMLTIRYDEVLHQNLVREKKAQELEEEKSKEQETSSGEVSEKQESTLTSALSVTEAVTMKHENVTELPVKIRDSYQMLTVDIMWEMPTNNAVLELFYPGNAQFCEPVTQSDTSASFVLKDVSPSTFTLHVLNYLECGNITMNMSGKPVMTSTGVESGETSGSSDTTTGIMTGRTS